MRIGWIEPHLEAYGGIRRVLELTNRLVDRGHDVTIYLPEGVPIGGDWMPARARRRRYPEGFEDELDIVVFNEETQWHLVDRFTRASKRAMYVLHYAKLYGKGGSWESIRLPVDLQLANSTWTADMVEADTGHRPELLLGGINPRHFRPVDTAIRYPVLTMGGHNRPWKGTDDVERACGMLGLSVETYAGKGISQDRMAHTYCAAEVFVVGSWFEGFGQPGLEALACGVPLVTTDNGGCRDYAIHETTALIVPPRDPEAMAAAIDRLRTDKELAMSLRHAGLQLVAEKFDWDRSAEQLERLLTETVDGIVDRSTPSDLQPNQRGAVPEQPDISCVVLQWDNLGYTQRCVESIRQHTDTPYELIVVDNGSEWEAANYAAAAGDQVVLNDTNTGFAHGMNQGLERATGRYVAFVNNDTVLPEAWASKLVETMDAHPNALIGVPAVTNAGNPRTVRDEPGDDVENLAPFEAPPSAVVYVARRDEMRALGGWDEDYAVASGEDVDLAFTVWANDRDFVYDSRVLVDHIGKGSAVKLGDWRALWDRNREQFLARWMDPANEVPRLDDVSPERHARGVATGRGVAEWMNRFYRAREDLESPRRASLVLAHQGIRTAREVIPKPVKEPMKRGAKSLLGLLQQLLPQKLWDALEHRLRILFRSGS